MACRATGLGLALAFSSTLLCPSALPQTPQQIEIPTGSSLPLQRAAEKLAEDYGWDPARAVVNSGGGEVLVLVDPAQQPSLGTQGYALAASTSLPVQVTGATEAGAANGVHGLRRRLRGLGLPTLATLSLTVTQQPSFARRGIMVAPYHFGGQQGLNELGPDTWGLDEWIEYVDFLRLMNANFIEVFPLRMHDPSRSHTFLEGARFDVWENVLHYCHEVGMEFHFAMLFNQVPEGFTDDFPGLAVDGIGHWLGTSANLLVPGATTEVMAAQQATYNKFAAADAFVFMWNDGGAGDYSSSTLSDPVQALLQMVNFAQNSLQAAGSSARMIFWGWLMEPWYPVFASSLFSMYPMLSTFYQDALSQLPTGMEWLQESDRHYALTGLSGLQDPFASVLQAGFTDLSNFFYLTHPEKADNLLPRPMIDECIAELTDSYGRGVTGITGYRLSPRSRRLNDYVVLRLAENHLLQKTDLIDELAAHVTEGDASLIPPVSQAIADLDAARPPLSPSTIFYPLSTAALTLVGLPGPLPEDLQDLSAMTQFLAITQLLNSGILNQTQWQSYFDQLLSLCQSESILQGFARQPQWQQEAGRRLLAFVERLKTDV